MADRSELNEIGTSGKEFDYVSMRKINKGVLRSIYARLKHFGNGEILLSRTEHDKFGLTDWGLRMVLRVMRRNGMLRTGGKISNSYYKTNMYTLSKEFISFLVDECAVGGAFDIVLFNNDCTSEKALKLLGIDINQIDDCKKNVVVESTPDYKYYYNKTINVITRYSKHGLETKWFNLFNGLKELFGYKTSRMISILKTC